MQPAMIRQTLDKLSRLTVWRILERTATRLPDKIALIEGERRLAYSEVIARSSRLAEGFFGLGLRKGDVAAIYMPNSIEFVTVFYALQKLGVIVAWLNPSYRQTEAQYIISNSGAKALFIFEEWQGFDYLTAAVGIGDVPTLEKIVVAGPQSGRRSNDPRVLSLADIKSTAAKSALPDVGPDDVSMLIYTSGTTGRSKGATIGQSQVIRAGWAYTLGVDATEDDIFIAFLPMAHSYGCGALLVQPLLLGATVTILDVFTPERAFAVIEKDRVTLQHAAPVHYILELKHPKRKDYDLSSLRAGLIAGQLAPKNLISDVQQEMGIYISSFLGASEVGPGLSIILPYGTDLEVRERYIGYPIEGTQAKVIDPATGAEKEPGEVGELLLSGWHVTRGYWKNPEETSHQIRNGWLHTGDLCAKDANGCFRILGRLKEWINRGGYKIIPSEIEAFLVQHPRVMEVCVVGTPNPVLGESICACVKIEEGCEALTLEEARRLLEGKVAPHKLPDELMILRDFPRLPGGMKVNKFGQEGLVELAKTSPDKQTLHR